MATDVTHGDLPFRAGADQPRRVFAFNGGFFTQQRVRRIMQLAGYPIRAGLPDRGDLVAIWGDSPTAQRGRHVAGRFGADLLRVEDSFLRSLHPGRAGEPPLGLNIDLSGVHFDGREPSDLEDLLMRHPLDDTALLDRARHAIARIRDGHLTKYSAVDPTHPAPEPGYVLVIDQTRGDASVTASGADRDRFREMLIYAMEEHPAARVLIRTHPETKAGYRAGHFDDSDLNDRVTFCDAEISPWTLLDGAVGVYTVSSQLGFEAILAGHKPRVFGQPFYAGWGLSLDDNAPPRRERRLTRPQLFAAAMILYPTWYDPFQDCLCPLERVLDVMEAQTRAWREDRHGWIATGMRLWKRKPLQGFFGGSRKVIFDNDPARARARADASGRRWMVWAGKARDADTAVRVEDGFLRSRGLGAALVPPLSLITDDRGIYYDPTRPSMCERLIAERETLRPDQAQRARALISAIVDAGLSKYNLGQGLPDLPIGHRVLVPGQVEDDASIRTGTQAIASNRALLETVRAARPDALILYKPHPDVEAGLRPGAVDVDGLADVILGATDPAGLLSQVDEVWTMTSLLGFEALLRNVPVTVLGTPFYAGWGLTTDRGAVPARRRARPTLEGLVHAVLIDYPRYVDPVTAMPCPAEVAVERLASGMPIRRGAGNRVLAKLQGAFATYAHVWR